MGLADLRNDVEGGGLAALRGDVEGGGNPVTPALGQGAQDGLKPEGPKPDTRSGVTRLYQDYLAKPVTKAASFAANQLTEPLVAAERIYQGEPAGQVAKSYLTPGGITDTYRRSASVDNPLAELAVPQTPLQAGAMAGTMGAGVAAPAVAKAARATFPAMEKYAPALSRILGGAVGGEVGGQAEGAPTGRGAAVGGGGAAGGEVLGGFSGWARSKIPGAKAAINERQSSGVLEAIDRASPALGATVRGTRAAMPGQQYLSGGKTAAALEDTALNVQGKNTLSDVMEKGMLDTTLASGGKGISAPALQTYWEMLPRGNPLADETVRRLAPSPSGTFTVSQAEDLLGRMGAVAFKGEKASPIGRTAEGIDLRNLYKSGVGQTENALPGVAGEVFRGARGEYGAGNQMLEMLRERGAFQGLPAHIFASQPALQKYVSQNRAEMEAKLGPAAWKQLTEALFGGAPVGTRSLLTPGSGGMADAAMQTFGRGTNSGAAGYLGVPLRTGLPNIGSQYPGKPPLALPDMLRKLLDVGGQRGAGAGMDQP